jgi:hypothetical protein
VDLPLRAVAEYVRRAETEELLDRVTVFRELTEPAAVDLMEGELSRRGQTPEMIADHDRVRRETALVGSDGTALRCWRCARPAVAWRWRWHRVFGRLPVFPLRVRECAEHA